MRLSITIDLPPGASASDASWMVQQAMSSSGRLFTGLEVGDQGTIRDIHDVVLGTWAVESFGPLITGPPVFLPPDDELPGPNV